MVSEKQRQTGSEEHRRRRMGGDTTSSSSSSGEEDGDCKWKEAINSVATTTTYTGSNANGTAPTCSDNNDDKHKPKKLTHYQIQAQKLLDGIVESSIEIVRTDEHVSHEDLNMDEGGIRLFKRAPPGIKFDHVDELQGPTKKPRILRGPEIDEKSKKFVHLQYNAEFRRKLESVVVDGLTIIAAASDASQKARDKVEAKHEAAKAAAKREEERVAALKKIRGERWLPSMAKEMQNKSQR
ncbi:hypothetical protein Leryth_024121 [Lithospermum erythrorhizon]|nr:hypothetical protein Leryth_024121 [Lithospermum erythrorhizon]